MNRKCKDARGSIKTCGGNVAVCHILFMKVIININVIPYTLTFILLKFHSISIRGLLFIGFKKRVLSPSSIVSSQTGRQDCTCIIYQNTHLSLTINQLFFSLYNLKPQYTLDSLFSYI